MWLLLTIHNHHCSRSHLSSLFCVICFSCSCHFDSGSLLGFRLAPGHSLHRPQLVAVFRFWSWAQSQRLGVLGAAGAGGSGDPGECLLIRGGQIDHEEDAVPSIVFLLRAAAGGSVLSPAATYRGQQLAVSLGVLQVLQSYHLRQAHFTVQTETLLTTKKQEDDSSEEEEGNGCYNDVGNGGRSGEGPTWTLTLQVTQIRHETCQCWNVNQHTYQ